MFISETLKRLLILLSDGEFHSGTELSQQLGLSRTAIWKHLHNLSGLGIEYAALPGKGYRLQHAMQLLNSEKVHQYLNQASQTRLQRLEIHDVLDSTNAYLMQRARDSSATGLVCVAEHQTAGRGRRGREWVSPYGHNVYLSLLWRYAEDTSVLSGMSLAIGVAVIRALRQLGLVDVQLKWPNDIYHQQRKMGGILLEVSGESSGPCHVVVGLGLNLHLSTRQAKSIHQPWTDWQRASHTDHQVDRNRLLALLINEMLAVVADYQSRGLSAYLDEWRAHDCTRHLPVRVESGEWQIEGIAEGIDDNGLLLLRDSQDQLRRFASGEISLRLS